MKDLGFLSDWGSKTDRSLQLLRSGVDRNVWISLSCFSWVWVCVCVCVYKRLTDIQTNHKDTGLGRGGSEGAGVASTFVGRVDVCPSRKPRVKLFPHIKEPPICGLYGDSIHTFLCFLSPCLFWTSGENISYASRFPSSQVIKKKNKGA